MSEAFLPRDRDPGEEDGFARAPELTRLDLLDAAWAVAGHGRRLDAVREAAPDLRRRIAGGKDRASVRTLPVSRFPYPIKYAFGGAAWHPAPLCEMTHRCLLLQFTQNGAVKNLLWNPTDVEGAKRTPFFVHLLGQVPKAIEKLLTPPALPSLEAQLQTFGLGAEDIDYVAFDHFHTQDLRRLLGTGSGAGPRFPHARLLAPRNEWDDWAHLHPMQRAWYVPDGRDGVDRSRVVLTDGDLALGESVVLARTPGHSSGNQTLFFGTSDGIWGCAENGTCADAYAPAASKIAGVARHARAYGIDLILNFNTPELGADEYTSMTLERCVVDRVAGAGDFVRMFPSSEVTRSVLAPGLEPTHWFGAITVGELRKRADQTAISGATASNRAPQTLFT